MRFDLIPAAGLACLLALTSPALAHFQEIIPSDDVLPEGGTVRIDLVFTHPFEMGPVMEMKKPARIGVMRDGAITDLMPGLIEKTLNGATTWTLTEDLPGARRGDLFCRAAALLGAGRTEIHRPISPRSWSIPGLRARAGTSSSDCRSRSSH